jgi:hypothetical protein
MKNVLFLIIFGFLTTSGFAAEKQSNYSELTEICSQTECYTILKKLGEGAFGKVYAVEDSKGQQFALKSYKYPGAVTSHYYNDMEREFLRGQIFDHPNIIKSYDFFVFETPDHIQTHNLVLQLVNGKTLADTLRGALTERESMEISIQFIGAIEYAFSQGYMHLDLHGNNIMLSDEPNIMIIDIASFATFDEVIHQFFNIKSQDDSNSSKLVSTLDKNLSSLLSESRRISSITAQDNSIEGIRAHKIQRFLKNNPKLLEAMRKVNAVNDRSMSKDIAEKKSRNSIYHKVISQYYFNAVSDVCAKVIWKSNLDRFERIDMRTAIKKMSWNYEADIEENCSDPLEYYLEDLTKLLTTFIQ